MNPTKYLLTHVGLHAFPIRTCGRIGCVFPYPATRLGREEFPVPGATRSGGKGFFLSCTRRHKVGWGRDFSYQATRLGRKGISYLATRPGRDGFLLLCHKTEYQ
ncbi:hypothetical protein Adt_03596 [Abeliophyllum distichum]|uniref:Ribosomal protein L2 n=1 Tax=Abeliophyllum distichum TaxID=126358 RepID=A0ABD1W119_9LAMI